MKVSYILFLAALSAAILLLLSIQGSRDTVCDECNKTDASVEKSAVCGECNVIIVSIDSLRADHLGCYGYARNTSPNIDSLARDSVLFKNCFSQSSHTTASHMSIFTSLYPDSHGLKLPYIRSIYPNVTTLTEILKANGYKTIWVASLKDESLSLNAGFEKGFDYFIEDIKYENYTDYFWGEALDWIRKNSSGNKFYMFLYTHKVHDPYTPSNKTIMRFTDRINSSIVSSDRGLIEDAIKKGKSEFSPDSGYQTLTKEFWSNVNTSSETDVEYVKLLYDSEIYEADEDIKRLIDTLENEKLLNKTILVITSDHGEEFMEHGNVRHSDSLYDASIHVPLVIRIPGIPGKKVPHLAQSIDIMPTILDFLNITTPKQAQGVSLYAVVTHDSGPLTEYAYGDLFGRLYSIRSSEWKYMTDFDNFKGLYNIREDPLEQRNMAENETETAMYMRIKLEEHINKTK